MAIGAPWYVRNTTIHKYIKIPLIKETLHNIYLCHHSTLNFTQTLLSGRIYKTCYLTGNIDALRENVPQTF